MAAVRHLGFVKFKFLTVGTVKRPILHQRTKFRKDRSNRCGDIAIFVIFQDGGRRHLGFKKKFKFKRLIRCEGPTCVVASNFIKIGGTFADIWRINAFLNGGRPPSWICWAPTGTTNDDHFVVFIVMPNLVKINAVVSIT